MNDYPRDLVNKDGKIQEFKSKAEVPPGWFTRDTHEEVNPDAEPAPAPAPKKRGKAKADEADGEPEADAPAE